MIKIFHFWWLKGNLWKICGKILATRVVYKYDRVLQGFNLIKKWIYFFIEILEMIEILHCFYPIQLLWFFKMLLYFLSKFNYNTKSNEGAVVAPLGCMVRHMYHCLQTGHYRWMNKQDAPIEVLCTWCLCSL